MPYNPSLPADHAQIVAAELRNQLNALKALNDAQQSRWDTLATQLADITPLEIMVSDPPTQNDVQSIVYQANAMLAAVKAALT